ncbi:MAG: DUF4340 domain-containing protein [Ruminiclostridium sp.]
MSKNKQILLFSAIGIAVLGAITALLLLTAPKPEEEEQETTDIQQEDTSLVLLDRKAEEVTKLTVRNSLGEYEITPTGDEEDPWTIADISTAPLLSSSLSSTVENAVSITAKQFVEETDDIKKYGLAEPTAEVFVEFSDGTSHSFKIGDDVPNSTTTVYMTVDGKNVYTCNKSSFNTMTSDKLGFVNTTVIPEYNQSSGEEVIKMTVERADLEEPLVIETNPADDDSGIQVYAYRMTSPYSAYADLADAPNFMYSLFGLTAESAQWVGLDETDYLMAGLNEPTCKITVETNLKTYTITLGTALVDTTTDENGVEKTEVKSFYGISSEVPDVLYRFNISDIAAVTINPKSLISKYFLMPYIYSLDSVEYSDKEGRNFTLGFETIPGEETVNEDGETVKGEDIRNHYLNGEMGDTELIKDMYQYLISAAGEDLYLEEGGRGELLATVTYTYADKSRGKDVVEFYASENDRKVIISLNGENLFKTRQMYVTQLYSNVDSFLSGGEIVQTY